LIPLDDFNDAEDHSIPLMIETENEVEIEIEMMLITARRRVVL